MTDWRHVLPTVPAGEPCPTCGSTEGDCIFFEANAQGEKLDRPYHRPRDCTFDEPCGRISECRWCEDFTLIGLRMAEPEDALE